ncbi:MAG: PPC domain-containing protein [Chloroflexota bacterium]
MKVLLACLCIMIVLLSQPVHTGAQDAPDPEAPPSIQYGEVVSGRIDSSNPSRVYTFEALRCDILAIRLRTVSGDLDPVLTVLDGSGTALALRDDSGGGLDVTINPLRIPRGGTYSIVVGRFGYGLGTTTGSFELIVERIGNGSEPNCAMRYGDTVFWTISSMQPEVVYSFRAQQGDIINVRMDRRSGDLDPYLQLVDSGGVVLEFNDDAFGFNTKNAAIQNFVIPQTGTYFVFATRYGLTAGTSTGTFFLRIEEADNSGLGNSPLTALPLEVGSQVEGELTENQFERFYRFEARQNDIITASMTRLTGNLDSVIVLANASLQELAVNDDLSNETQNARIANYVIPADGSYYLIATRFESQAGRTVGRYRLEVTNEGNAFADVPPDVRRIQYGTSTTGTIDPVTPEVLYAFWGEAGDTVRVTMDTSEGNLDPFVSILTSDGTTVLVSDDDGGTNRNARIDRFSLPSTGIYYIRASRYSGGDNPDTRGSFILVLAQIFD